MKLIIIPFKYWYKMPVGAVIAHYYQKASLKAVSKFMGDQTDGEISANILWKIMDDAHDDVLDKQKEAP